MIEHAVASLTLSARAAALGAWMFIALAGLSGCQRKESVPIPADAGKLSKLACEPDNGGLQLPPGFCAVVVADYFANLRDVAVNANGDVYGSHLNRRLNTGGVVAMRDEDGDGRADDIRQYGEQGGVGLAVHAGYLYLGTDRAILRYRLDESLAPAAAPEVIVDGLPAGELHASKTLTFDDAGGMYVSIGAPSNACQQQDASPGMPGQDPCPELADAAGVWRFDASRQGQHFGDGEHYASGIRHALAIDWEPQAGQLYLVQHGRDQLSELWPQYYTAEQDQLLPAEEMLRAHRGAAFGWPYCYHDPLQRRRVLAPEYGGDGMRVDRCAAFPEPVVAFPAHYGPNDMLFYRGHQFPKRYRGGAFIAFHGAYRTLAGQQAGYQVTFVPMDKGMPRGEWEVFANGFSGTGGVEGAPAEHRPTGLAEGPDGSIYIADSVSGRIWRVIYRPPAPGSASSAG